MSGYICRTFYTLGGLNFVFSSFNDRFVSGVGRQKVKKILYDKYTPILTIRDCHVSNHFNDKFKFIHLYHVGYFINGDGGELTAGYICRTFYTFGD